MDTIYEKKSGIERQSEVLIQALNKAAQNDGMLLNATYKLKPHFYNKDLRITPVNALLMAMHSDNGNYKSNAYTTFQHLQEQNAAIRKGQKGVPFIWECNNEYVETANPANKISKTDYNNLPEEEKGKYQVNHKENIFTLFNLDQTTLHFIHKEAYQKHIEASGESEPRDDKALRMEVNQFISKMRSNLLPIRRDGIGVAHYDNTKDVIHIPAQNVFSSYPEYVQAVAREIAYATGVPQRLNRFSSTATNVESNSKESLINDLVSAHRLLEFGLPSKLSASTLAAVPSIINKIKTDPNYTKSLFAEITRSIRMIKKAENGEKINIVQKDIVEPKLSNPESQEKNVDPVHFDQITILKDDDGKWTLVARPEQMKTFAIHPTKQDISAYFDSLKFPDKNEGIKFRTDFAQKYYGIVSKHPELNVDVFKTDATAENIGKIDKVNIFRSRDNKNMLVAYVNNKALQPVELNQSLYQRVWLSDDRENYKKSLAASLYAETLNKDNKKNLVETENQTSTKTLGPVARIKEEFLSLLEEYSKMKQTYPDTILLFRVNDAYTSLSDDAVIVSEKARLQMTTFNNVRESDGSSLRAISFPFHQLDTYLPRLVKNGCRVAICDYKPTELINKSEAVQSESKEETAKETMTQTNSFHR